MFRPIAYSAIDTIIEYWDRHAVPCLIRVTIHPQGLAAVRLVVSLRATEDDEWTEIDPGDEFDREDMARLAAVAGKLVGEAWERPAVPSGWNLDIEEMGRDS